MGCSLSSMQFSAGNMGYAGHACLADLHPAAAWRTRCAAAQHQHAQLSQLRGSLGVAWAQREGALHASQRQVRLQWQHRF